MAKAKVISFVKVEVRGRLYLEGHQPQIPLGNYTYKGQDIHVTAIGYTHPSYRKETSHLKGEDCTIVDYIEGHQDETE